MCWGRDIHDISVLFLFFSELKIEFLKKKKVLNKSGMFYKTLVLGHASVSHLKRC